MKKLLITGFQPFGGEPTNPSFEAIKLLDSKIKGIEVIKKELPVTFESSAKILKSAIEEHNPDAVICVGQAGSRFGITIERVAINLKDAVIADNDGVFASGEKIVEGGKNAYFATMPVKRMVEAIHKIEIPASLSTTAGTYVCNTIMYHLLHMLENDFNGKIGTFIHVPYLSSQVVDKKNMPSLSKEEIAKALSAAIEVAFEEEMVISQGESH